MSRGFLDDIAGSKRLRMAIAGKNARDMSLPTNHVAFDSDWLGAAGIALTGTFTISANASPNTSFVTWATLGAKPLAEIAFLKSGFYTNIADGDFGTTTSVTLIVGPTGITGDCKNLNYPVVVAYVIYRIFPT
ncbi:hypothetical protein [Mesorhizobium qingshengii]|uniref:Uncharacterized protein n=1 Tax=Mesorhizobium qingshengii TaxID=1165689 RepID=A0A1G5UZP4_9HYPH|nr:hypothetical protein [Mesorhizobium qingshengii]SDA39074.1 hypothetical protein SAMN02927914_00106 [Mesorhizobium qingshengii]